MSRFIFERGICWDDKHADDLNFKRTVEELEKHRECIKRIYNSLNELHLDELVDFIESEANRIL